MMIAKLAPDVRQLLLAITMTLYDDSDMELDTNDKRISSTIDSAIRTYHDHMEHLFDGQLPEAIKLKESYDKNMALAAKKVFDNQEN